MRSTLNPSLHRAAALLLASGTTFFGVSLFASTASASFSSPLTGFQSVALTALTTP